jgi:hypothetical protein
MSIVNSGESTGIRANTKKKRSIEEVALGSLKGTYDTHGFAHGNPSESKRHILAVYHSHRADADSQLYLHLLLIAPIHVSKRREWFRMLFNSVTHDLSI